MPTKTAAGKTRKQTSIAAVRKQAKAAKKAPARTRKKEVPTPADLPAAGKAEYLEVTRLLLDIVPAKGPGMPAGEVYDAVRARTSRKEFPGDTHRMWAKQALLDLATRGVVVEDGGSPARWRKA